MIVYNINVPQNDKGIQELEEYDEKMVNVKTFQLTEDEYLYLRKPGGLFSKFDKTFGTIIDVCEEEIITLDQLPDALVFTEKEINKNNDGLSALSKIRDSIVSAIEAKTFWEIDIFLE